MMHHASDALASFPSTSPSSAIAAPHRHVRVKVGAGTVYVRVSELLWARFVANFVDGNRSEAKSVRFVTVHALMEAAYQQGWREGRGSIRVRPPRGEATKV